MASSYDAKRAIRDVVESWAIWRDSGDWQKLATCWHSDGRMVATWFTGSVQQFVDGCKANWARGAMSCHFLGGTDIVVNGSRAIAQTKMQILGRSKLEGVLCDTVCTGRFYDFFEEREGRWAIVLRQPVYEKDRADPVDPNESFTLDKTLADQFPVGYRHLAYAQTQEGRTVRKDLPGLRGPEIEALYEEGREWLAGGPLKR